MKKVTLSEAIMLLTSLAGKIPDEKRKTQILKFLELCLSLSEIYSNNIREIKKVIDHIKLSDFLF